jgi:DNA polymerase-1
MVRAMSETAKTAAGGDRVFLVDGSFVFRAYFQSMNQDRKYNARSDGLPTGAVRLFATKLLQFVEEGALGVKPTHLAIDPRQERELLPQGDLPAYKAQPPATARGSGAAIPADARGGPRLRPAPIEQDRYEADDLIATYCDQALFERGADVLIISADKDLMQLVRPGVAFYDPAASRASQDRPERLLTHGDRFERWKVPRQGRRRHRVLGGCRPTRSSTSSRWRATLPTTCPARPASASRRRPSSSPSTATSTRCSPAPARSSSRSAARR